MRFIGDVHGKMAQYAALTTEVGSSIQVGDFGAGFSPLPNVGINHKFIRGNHDNPAICAASLNWIPDGMSDGDMFFVGGAYSIDQDLRIVGKDWWDDEEVSWQKLNEIIDCYANTKPRIMITHDCPKDIGVILWPYIRDNGSRTANALQAMFEIHQPKLWIFGHHHKNIDRIIDQTRFICLAELAYIDL